MCSTWPTGGTAVTDRHDDDNQSADVPAAMPSSGSEGVRIIGAEEAQAVLESGAVAHRIGDVGTQPDPALADVSVSGGSISSETFGGVCEAEPVVAEEPTAEHPAVGFGDAPPASNGEETKALDIVDLGADGEGVTTLPAADSANAAPAPEGLPHWSEPATGEVPIILPESELDDDGADLSGGLRFRTGSTAGWTDEELESFDGLEPESDDEAGLAALASPPEDDDVAFDREVAARRVRTTPTPRTRPSTGSTRSGGDGGQMPGGPAHPDMLVRVVTGVGMAVLALVCLSLGPDATVVLATLVVGVCTFELFQALHSRGFRPATAIAMLGSLTIVPLAYNRGEFAFVFILPLVMVFTLLWFVFEVVHTRPMVNVAVTVGGFVYVGVIGGFAGLLLTSENGVGLLLGVAIPVIAYDIFGYLIGSQLGKTRLAPAISPNKTVEGLIGGMTGSIIVSVLIVKQITPWGNLTDALALGITVAFMAPLGDLAESMLKRDLGIKDFGAILPGHGGVLDRFDALLFCMPAVYFLARALTIG